MLRSGTQNSVLATQHFPEIVKNKTQRNYNLNAVNKTNSPQTNLIPNPQIPAKSQIPGILRDSYEGVFISFLPEVLVITLIISYSVNMRTTLTATPIGTTIISSCSELYPSE